MFEEKTIWLPALLVHVDAANKQPFAVVQVSAGVPVQAADKNIDRMTTIIIMSYFCMHNDIKKQTLFMEGSMLVIM